MKTNKLILLITALMLTSLIFSACSSGEEEAQAVDYSAMEPEVVDLGHGATMYIRGLPGDITLDAVIDLDMKAAIPDSKNFDYVFSEVTLVSISQNGGPATVEEGMIELCYTTTLTPGMNEQPALFYWDTTKDPLQDGRQLRISNVVKEPELIVCSMVQTSGAYALVAR